MSELIDYYMRFKTETIYLWEDENEMYIKSVPGKGYFAKFPGKEEGPIAANSGSVTRAIEARKEISKAEYDKA